MLLKKIINILLLLLSSLILIFPNSFQMVTAALLTGINLLILLKYKKLLVHNYLLFFWLLLSAAFMFYISISDIKTQYKFEISLKYIYFPLLWLNLCTYIKQNFSLEWITKTLFVLSYISFFTVFILYGLMLNGYYFVQYFFDNPNIDNDYFLGFTLNVYGNLIFFAAGLFILPKIFKSKVVEYFYIVTFILVAVISGRTALLCALIIGFFILLIRYIYMKKPVIPFIYVLSLIGIIIGIAFLTEEYLNYRFLDYLKQGSLRKLITLGGQERTSQSSYMFEKIINNPWGIGFGNIGLERNAQRDFKYEVLILATLMRFGIFVFTAIAASLYPIYKEIIAFSRLNDYKKFYLIGFFSIIAFSFTNPYLESFDFQWMFFCPLVFLSDFSNENYRWKLAVSKK